MSTPKQQIVRLVPFGQPEDHLFVFVGVGAAAVIALQGAGAPTNGTSGTGANKANKGSQYTDSTNGDLYINIGTTASPTWAAVRLTEGT